MKFSCTEHGMEQFAYDLNHLGMMISMSDEQVLVHCKDAFPLNIQTQMLEIDDMDIAVG